jgi:hypothetical protein
MMRPIGNRRLVGWLTLVLLPASVGGGLYLTLPSEPRWTIADSPHRLIACDDAVLATYCAKEERISGPVQLWDVGDGREIGRFFTTSEVFHPHYMLCKNGRYFVAVVDSDKPGVAIICWLDLHERREWQVEASLGFRAGGRLLSADGEFCFMTHQDPAGTKATLFIVDTTTGAVRHRVTMRAPYNGVGWLAPAADGNADRDGPFLLAMYRDSQAQSLVISARTGEVTTLPPVVPTYGIDMPWPIVDRGEEGIWLWDPATSDWRCRLDGPLAKGVFLSPDLRLVLCRPRGELKDAPIQLFDSQTGELYWQMRLPLSGGHHFAPDSRRLIISSRLRPGALRIACYDLENKRLLWQRDWDDDSCFVHFSRDGQTLALDFGELHRTELLDAHSGETRHTLPVPEQVGTESTFTRDGEMLFVNEQAWAGTTPFWQGWLDRLFAGRVRNMRTVSIYDVPSGRRLFRERTEHPVQWRITPDRRSVVLLSDDGIACWDIPPARPLRWIVGVPVGLAAVLQVARFGWRYARGRPLRLAAVTLALRSVWRRWRRPPTATAAPQGVAPCP